MDRAIAALAGRQHGVASRAQLEAIGLARGGIARRLERGRLHPVHRGVYAVGHHVVSIDGRWTAAVLAIGDDAALSHRSAAALWGIRPASRPRVEVTVPRVVRSRAGLQVHQRPLPPDEVTKNRGIPVTTPPRTLLDLATMLRPIHLERAMNEAERQQLTDPLSLTALCDRYPDTPGRKALQQAIERAQHGTTITRSELEDAFLAFLDLHALPRPVTNAPLAVGGTSIVPDCLWRDYRLIAELDGYAFYASRAAFESDRARDRGLQAAGWRVVRVTWRQLRDDERALAAELGALLAH